MALITQHKNMETPRRIRLDLNEPAELAIYNAMTEVEKLPGDVRLTHAVIKLGEAKNLVADYIDGVPIPAEPRPGKAEFFLRESWERNVRNRYGGRASFDMQKGKDGKNFDWILEAMEAYRSQTIVQESRKSLPIVHCSHQYSGESTMCDVCGEYSKTLNQL
jgi:hypothetical protein